MRVPLAASGKPTGGPEQAARALYVFEHKT